MHARLMAVIASLIIGPVAQAEPVQLACSGQMHYMDLSHPSNYFVEKSLLSLVLDRSAETLRVQDYGSVKIIGQSDVAVIFSGPSSDRPEFSLVGDLNSITGEAKINIFLSRDKTNLFEGTCNPARSKF